VLATLPEATLAASYRRWGQSRPHAKLPYVTRRPPNLPLFPERVYRGWVGPWLSWRDWLGLPPAEVVAPQQAGATRAATAPHARGGRAAAPAGECRAAARAARCPPHPPPRPCRAAAPAVRGALANARRRARAGSAVGEGGGGRVAPLPFREARRLARALSLPSQRAWVECCRGGGLPSRVPPDPARAYAGEWRSWADWLGCAREWC
jgi:hypothetical protein